MSERLVREAWDEAGLKHYSHLYVIGFAIDPKARQFIESAGKIGAGCTYLQTTMDLQMGDLPKWEQTAAYYIDTHPRVRAFAKNALIHEGAGRA